MCSKESFSICYKSDRLDIIYNPVTKIKAIKDEIHKNIGIAPKSQKLVYKGILDDEMLLSETKILPGAKVILIVTSYKELEQLQQHEAKVKERVTLAPLKPRSTNLTSLSKFTFKKLEALPEFTDKNKALEYLQKLKDDRGIRAVMEKHQWEVGSLIELSPSERTILGYNRNKGQIIAVRLRTDDLTGFIHYPSVKKVLLHELAHMVFSEHDKDFHQLNRQLNKEVVDLDWTQSKGRTTGHKEETYNPSSFVRSSADSGRKVGGKRINMNDFNNNAQYRREVTLKAVELRLSKEEEELTLSCGASKSSDASENTTAGGSS